MTGVIAALTLKRLLRGRAVWISALIAALPVVFAALTKGRRGWGEIDTFMFTTLMLAVLPGMFVASSIGEDIEDRTTTYVWSRPVPRWAVIAGKLVALAPVCAALVTGSWIASNFVGGGTLPSALSIVALAAGTLVACIVAGTLGTLVPKHSMAITIAYMLFFDLPVGGMPFSLAQLSVTHQLRTLSEVVPGLSFGEPPVHGAIGLALLAVVWFALALWRIRRLEA